jgi:hypothetical protein
MRRRYSKPFLPVRQDQVLAEAGEGLVWVSATRTIMFGTNTNNRILN